MASGQVCPRPAPSGKAQEKLKEINEAYELLSSGKSPRPAPPPPSQAAESVYASSPSSRGSWKWAVIPVLLFAAVFAVTTKVLLERRGQPLPQAEAEPVQIEAATRTEPNTRTEATRKSNRNESAPEDPATSVEAQTSAPTPALATVTVLIDPESGLLAKADCPVRSRMTYPSGSQPTAHCTINHTPPPKDSKLKSLKEKILR